jgi:hypothetical protein
MLSPEGKNIFLFRRTSELSHKLQIYFWNEILFQEKEFDVFACLSEGDNVKTVIFTFPV